MATLFTKIIQREIPATIEYEDEHVIVIRDIAPKAPIHLLIIPKKEIPTINDVQPEDSELIGNVVLTAKKMAERLQVAEQGYRLVWNCNEAAGQTVFHIHLHFLAGRDFSWPPG